MEYVKSTELYHHGVLGQTWGKRNGPPYPLKPNQHSAAEKKAGWQKSVKGGDGDVKKKKHSVKEVLKTTKEVYRDVNRYSMKNPKETFKNIVSHPIQSSTPYMIKQRLNGKKTIIDKKVEEQNSGKTGGFQPTESQKKAIDIAVRKQEQYLRELPSLAKKYGLTDEELNKEQNQVNRIIKALKSDEYNSAIDNALQDYEDTSVVGGKTGYISRSALEKAENSSRRRLNNDATNYRAKRADVKDAKAANEQEKTEKSKAALKAAKQQQKEAENKLKLDIKAEKGRELYSKGKTVEKYTKGQAVSNLLGAGGNFVASQLAKNGDTKAAVFLMAASTSAAIGYDVYAEIQKNKLRAYYAQ